MVLRFLLPLVYACFTFRSSSGVVETERTLAMIKPDGLLGNYTDMIKKVIGESGFSIVREMATKFDEESASRFYAEHSSKSFFASLIKYITSGPVSVMVLEKRNAVADWRALIGPTDASKAKIIHPHWLFPFSIMCSLCVPLCANLLINSSGQCVEWIQNRIACMVLTPFKQLNERSHSSLETYTLVKQLN